MSLSSRVIYSVGAGFFIFFGSISVLFFYPKDAQVPLTEGVIAASSTGVIQSEDQREALPKNKETAAPFSARLRLLVVGDIMLDRSVLLKTQAAKDFSHPFLLIDPLMEQYDLRLANLEGPITTFSSIANGTGGARLTFTFSPQFIEPLKKRVDIVSLANNHTTNFGKKGLDQTRAFLDEAGILSFGDPNNTPGWISATTTQNNISLGFVGYHQLVRGGFGNVLDEVHRLASLVDVLIVMPHWGEEYIEDHPTAQQTAEAQQLIDAGATMVIGAHPHVVQPVEIYKGNAIFYSLGNFIFDQYFSEETMTGLAVGIEFEKTDGDISIDYTLTPLTITKESQPVPATPQKTESVLTRLSLQSKLGDVSASDIVRGQFTLTK